MAAEIDPDLALHLAKATADAYHEATEELIAIVARQTREGRHDPNRWAAQKLASTRALTAQATQVVDRLNRKTPGLIDRAIRAAYDMGGRNSMITVGGFNVTHTRAVNALVTEAVTKVTSTHAGILRATTDAYRDVVFKASTLVDTGALSLDQAINHALGGFADKGVTGFVDKAGRRWRLDRYAEMATRTAVGRSMVAGTLDRLVGDGRDLVIVSDHHRSCEVCAPFEGKVLSISGATSGTVEDGNGDRQPIVGTVAEAQAAGLQHPNCRHSLAAFIPGLSTPPKPRRPEPDPGVERRRVENQEAEQVRAARRRKATSGKAPAPLTSSGGASGGGGGGGRPPSPPDLPDDDGLDELRHRIEEAFAKQARDATPAQRTAVVDWQGRDRDYELMQRVLRGGDTSGIPSEIYEAIEHLEALMRLGSTPSGLTVWRGVRSVEAAFRMSLEDLGKSLHVPIPQYGFTPTSLSRAVAIDEFTVPPLHGGAAILRVEVSQNTPAIWAPPLGDPAVAYQDELLIVHGATIVPEAIDTSGTLPEIRVSLR